MISLGKLVSEETVRLDFEAETRRAVLEELAGMLGGNDDASRESVRDDLAAREQVSSTGIGGGVAFPHARADFLPSIRLAALRTREPVEFGAMDGRPVDLFFAIAGPAQNRRDYLAVLSQLSYLLRSEPVRDEFRSVRTPGELVALVERHAPEPGEGA